MKLLKKFSLFCILTLLTLVFIQSGLKLSVYAVANSTINLQSKLVSKTTGLNVLNGTPACINAGADTCDFKSNIYSDPSAGTLLWSEPITNVELGATGGYFNLSLNSVCNSWTAPSGSCSGTGITWGSDPTIYIEIQIDTDGDGDFASGGPDTLETFTRQLFSSVPYAYYADNAGALNGVADTGFVKLVPGAVQTVTTAATPLISINENDAGNSPNLIQVQVAGTNVYVLNNAGQLQLPTVGSTGGLLIGGDIELYRSSADVAMLGGSLLPSVDNTYDLGSTANRWRDLYLGPASLNITSTTGTGGSGANYTLAEAGYSGNVFRIATTNVGTATGGAFLLSSSTPAASGNSAFRLSATTDLSATDSVFTVQDNTSTALLNVLGNGNLEVTTAIKVAAGTNNLLATTAAAGASSVDLYWGNSKVCIETGAGCPQALDIDFINNSGGTLSAGAIVVRDNTLTSGFTLANSDTDERVLGVLVPATCANGATCKVRVAGKADVVLVGAVARGDYIHTSVTTPNGRSSITQERGMLGVSLTTDASAPYNATVLLKVSGADLTSGGIIGSPAKPVDIGIYGDIILLGKTERVLATSPIRFMNVYDATFETWRSDSSRSWYTETADNTGNNCLITDDRCGKADFPTTVGIVATDTNVYIYDSNTDKLWMRFDVGAGKAIQGTITSVQAGGGSIFFGTRGAGNTGIYQVDFSQDKVYYYKTNGRFESDKNIANRNTTNTFATNGEARYALPNLQVNDLDLKKVIEEYIMAAGTDAGAYVFSPFTTAKYEQPTYAGFLNGTASALTTLGGQPASFAFDRNYGTYYSSNVDPDTTPQWLKYTHSGNGYVAKQYSIVIAAFPTFAPRNWTFEASNDDFATAPVVLDTRTAITFVANVEQTFTVTNTTQYKYYRLAVTSNSAAGGFLVYDFNIGDIYASSQSIGATRTAYQAFDANTSTSWGTNAVTTGTLLWQSQEPVLVNRYAITNNNADALNTMPKDWTFQASNDASTWDTLDTRSGIDGWVGTAKKSFETTATFETTKYRYFRLNVSANNGGADLRIGEFEIYSSKSLLSYVQNSITDTINDVALSDSGELVTSNTTVSEYDIFADVHLDTVDQTTPDQILSTGSTVFTYENPSAKRFYITFLSNRLYIGGSRGIQSFDINPSTGIATYSGIANDSIVNFDGVDNIAAIWDMENSSAYGTGITTALAKNIPDRSTNTISTLISGAPDVVLGKVGDRALDFDNALNDNVRSLTAAQIGSLGSAFTVAGWIRVDGTDTSAGRGFLGNCDNATATRMFNVDVTGATHSLRIGISNLAGACSAVILDTNYDVTADVWTHITLTYDGSLVKIYANGDLVMSNAYSAFDFGAAPFYLGTTGSFNATTQDFDGAIDDVFIFKKTLLPAEIRRLMLRAPVTATVFTSSTIGSSTLNLEKDTLSGYSLEILEGTGAGQVRGIKGNTATTISTTQNFVTTPDSTSKFRLLATALPTRPGIKATTFSSTTIGSSTLAMTTNEFTGKQVDIISGTGSGQSRTVSTNTATTFTVSAAWSVTPDATSIFRYIYANGISAITPSSERNLIIGMNDGQDGGAVFQINTSSTTINSTYQYYYNDKMNLVDDFGNAWLSSYNDIIAAIGFTYGKLHVASDSHYWTSFSSKSVRNEIKDEVSQNALKVVDEKGISTKNMVVRLGNESLTAISGAFSASQTVTVSYGIQFETNPSIVNGNYTGCTADASNISVTSRTKTSFTLSRVGNYVNGQTVVCPVITVPWIAIGQYSATVDYTGADLAENYLTRDLTVDAADVVAIDTVNDLSVKKTSSAKDINAIGVVATKPAITIGPDNGVTPGVQTSITGQEVVNGTAKTVKVALAGRVPVKVNLEGGAIKRGDFLTPSSTPGYAMKATTPGISIGRALTEFNGTSTIAATLTGEQQIGQAQLTEALEKQYYKDQMEKISTQGKVMLFVQTGYYWGQLSNAQQLDAAPINTQADIPQNNQVADTLTNSDSLVNIDSNIEQAVGLVQKLPAQTNVIGSFTLAGLIVSESSQSINSIAKPLKFQALSDQDIDLFNGKFTFNSQGVLVAKQVQTEKLVIKGNLAGSVKLTKNSPVATVSSNLISAGDIVFTRASNQDVIVTAKIDAVTKQVTIEAIFDPEQAIEEIEVSYIVIGTN